MLLSELELLLLLWVWVDVLELEELEELSVLELVDPLELLADDLELIEIEMEIELESLDPLMLWLLLDPLELLLLLLDEELTELVWLELLELLLEDSLEELPDEELPDEEDWLLVVTELEELEELPELLDDVSSTEAILNCPVSGLSRPLADCQRDSRPSLVLNLIVDGLADTPLRISTSLASSINPVSSSIVNSSIVPPRDCCVRRSLGTTPMFQIEIWREESWTALPRLKLTE